MASKIKQYFSDIGDKIKTSMKIDTAAPFYYLTLVLIVILAVLVRMSPVANNIILIKAFDAWYQFDSFKQLSSMGLYDWLRFHDNQFWYPQGVDRFALRPGLLIAASLSYWFLNALGIPVTHLEVAFYFPAFMGGLTVLVMYYLGKEVLDKRAGLISAFFLAFSPGHMQRTVCGFFDNETVGVFAVLMVFLFFIKAVKFGKLSNGLIAGIFLGFLSLSWGGLTYVYGLLPLIVGILVLIKKYNARVYMAYTSTICVGLMIYSINPTFTWAKYINDFDVLLPLGFLILLTIYHLFYMQKGTGLYIKTVKIVQILAVPVAFVFVILLWQGLLPFDLAARLESILNPAIREAISLVASVGEHAPSPWSTFYYNALIPIILLIPGIFFAFKRSNAEDILMVVFLLSLFYFTGSMIRIVLLFAPAAALLGGYALSNIFKSLDRIMEKQPKYQKKRRRQVSRVLGRSEGLIVYSLFALLFFAQANHAINVSTNSLPYSDLMAAGQFHDWEETLTWMYDNLPGTSVVASWWDYGYWLTTIGNVTTINDNGTWNDTRIGLTGMAMMQTEEHYSVQIFEELRAEYVLVYFGHLVNGIGGDEGKWPWMVRICNDNTRKYEQMGALQQIREENWYGRYDSDTDTVDTVFDEEDYINSSNGKYRDAWFDSTLVKLMFDGEVDYINSVDINNAPPTVRNLYVSLYGGNNQEPITDDYGQEWTQNEVVNDNYDLQYFEQVYLSKNHLVKLYKIDYSALDTSFTVSDTYLDTNGQGFAVIENTGATDIEITNVNLKYGEKTTILNYTLEDYENGIVDAGTSQYLWFNASEEALTEGYKYSIEVDAEMGTYEMTETTPDTSILAPEKVVLQYDRDESSLLIEDNRVDAQVVLSNPSTNPTLITEISIGDVKIDLDSWSSYQSPLIIPPESTKELEFTGLTLSNVNDFSELVEIELKSVLNEPVNTVLGKSKSGFELTISPYNLEYLSENQEMFDPSDYSTFTGDYDFKYMPFNDESYLLENGSISLKIENTGTDLVSIREIYSDGDILDLSTFEVIDDHEFPEGYEMIIEPDDYRILQGTLSDVDLNIPKEIVVISMNEESVASDGAYFVPRAQNSSISIIEGENAMSTLFTNETVRLQVKNTGSETVVITDIMINGTETVALGESISLGVHETTIIEIPFEDYRVNISDSLSFMVIGETVNSSSITLEAVVPTLDELFNLVEDEDLYSHRKYTACSAFEDEINLMFAVENDEMIHIEGIYLQTPDDDEDTWNYLSWNDILLHDNVDDPTYNIIDDRLLEGSTSSDEETVLTALYYAEISNVASYNLESGDIITLRVITEEGYEVIINLEVE